MGLQAINESNFWKLGKHNGELKRSGVWKNMHNKNCSEHSVEIVVLATSVWVSGNVSNWSVKKEIFEYEKYELEFMDLKTWRKGIYPNLLKYFVFKAGQPNVNSNTLGH